MDFDRKKLEAKATTLHVSGEKWARGSSCELVESGCQEARREIIVILNRFKGSLGFVNKFYKFF